MARLGRPVCLLVGLLLQCPEFGCPGIADFALPCQFPVQAVDLQGLFHALVQIIHVEPVDRVAMSCHLDIVSVPA